VVITAGKPEYTLAEALGGEVTLRVEAWNRRDSAMLLAHPTVCLPYRLNEGETVTPEKEGGYIASLQLQSHTSIPIVVTR
jgi:hypothetical protein